MQSTAVASADRDTQAQGNEWDTFFESAHRAVRTRGVAQRIAMPVEQGGTDVVFQHHVAAALRQAQANGNPNPVLIGAIPFDLAQPSSLVIPLRNEFYVPGAAVPLGGQRQTRVLSSHSVPDRARFMQAVQQVVANFHYSDIRKAVLSRIFEVELDTDVDAGQLFERLRAQNATGYHFRMALADGGELVGASPELLVRKDGERLYSNPLAGSARRLPDPQHDRQAGQMLLQSGKDAREHSLVIDEVRRVLQPLCGELAIPAAPSLLSTAAMWHLSTWIEGVPTDPALGALELACKLHPTPAVCGFPTRQARKLIDLVEPFERGLFSGMVGWADAHGNGEWAVTIRCGRIHKKRISLFAGAGIVADSNPEMEWAETQAKLQTMLKALGVELPQQAREEFKVAA